ncbi:flagellar assembly protein FliW [Priestia koreensis]|uniref:Flagellar assembly factor FliW n=1 Tax=Priestia koreensis TaxID=284581 RepID=A0A0M0KF39_9BACI|nr:flagellar assembly protein FliW [Priestia koreensis]KOO37197.1 flagellar biosynthesis protein FliW [Priestia koreensis]
MTIETRYHGKIDVDQHQIITFSQGIPGFEEEKSFVLLSLNEDEIFYALQSTESAGLAFIVVNPFHFIKDYDFTLDESYLTQLDIKEEKEVEVYAILTVKENFEDTTANLQAPIILNTRNKQGKQIILTNTNYQTRHPLFKTNAK